MLYYSGADNVRSLTFMCFRMAHRLSNRRGNPATSSFDQTSCLSTKMQTRRFFVCRLPSRRLPPWRPSTLPGRQEITSSEYSPRRRIIASRLCQNVMRAIGLSAYAPRSVSMRKRRLYWQSRSSDTGESVESKARGTIIRPSPLVSTRTWMKSTTTSRRAHRNSCEHSRLVRPASSCLSLKITRGTKSQNIRTCQMAREAAIANHARQRRCPQQRAWHIRRVHSCPRTARNGLPSSGYTTRGLWAIRKE